MQKLPNSDLVLAMGICSIIGTLFCCGPFGILFSIIGLVSAKSAEKIYLQNPSEYMGYGNLNTGRIMSWIGLALSLIMLVLCILYFGVIAAIIVGSSNLH